jgi:hypothetical protein
MRLPLDQASLRAETLSSLPECERPHYGRKCPDSAGFRPVPSAGKRMSPMGRLADRRGLRTLGSVGWSERLPALASGTSMGGVNNVQTNALEPATGPMPAPISMDLRLRIVRAVERGSSIRAKKSLRASCHERIFPLECERAHNRSRNSGCKL